MKRLQISIEEDFDEVLAVEVFSLEALEGGLRRRVVRESLRGSEAPTPWGALVGDIDDEAGDIDEVVYGVRFVDRSFWVDPSVPT